MNPSLESKILGWKTCGADEFKKGNEGELYTRTQDLLGERVQVHTNRTKKVWSIHSVERPGACVAYAKDAVFLKDVRWVPPEIGAARGTYFPSSTDKGETGRRTVQAFAEGILLYAENDGDDSSNNYYEPRWSASLEKALACRQIEATYRPFKSDELGYFRGDDNQALYHSDYAVLEWVPDYLGRRVAKAYAYCDPKYFTERETSLFVESILCPSEGWMRKRYKTEKDFLEWVEGSEKGRIWAACRKG